MPTWTPPQVQVVPPVLPDTKGLQWRLFRHFKSHWQNVAVFELSDGTFVQDYPTPENDNTNIPYPWVWGGYGGEPYARVQDFLHGNLEFTQDPYIVKVFQEAGPISMNDAQKLINAGYGAYVGGMPS